MEFFKKPKESCKTKIGRYTGLEPVTVICRWYPSADCDVGRPVEGMSIVTKIPHIDIFDDVPPASFKAKGLTRLLNCADEMLSAKWFTDNDISKEWWRTWKHEHMPAGTAEEYVKNHAYNIPFRALFYDSQEFLRPCWSPSISSDYVNIDPQFEWPDIISAALNSVKTRFNREAHHPRLFVVTNAAVQASVEGFRTMTQRYYEWCNTTRAMTKEKVEAAIKRAVTYLGVVPALNVTKKELIDLLKLMNTDFMSVLYRPLSPDDRQYVDNVLLINDTSNAMKNAVVCELNESVVRRCDIKTLSPGVAVSPICMNGLLELLRIRDARICTSYHDVNPSSTEIKECLYFGPDFIVRARLHEGLKWDNIHRVYIFDHNPDTGTWAIVVVDIVEKKFYYINPRFNDDTPQIIDKRKEYQILINEVLMQAVDNHNGENWPCVPYHIPKYYPLVDDKNDSGVYVFIIAYCQVQNCPPSFKSEDIGSFRWSIAYWILSKELPY